MTKSNVLKDLFQYVSKKIERIDQFGEPVKLSINGNSTFQTKCGGICTILFATVIITYAVNRFLVFL